MTNDPLYDRLRELSWRRKLTAAEEAELNAWLAVHPETQADWETEAGLNDALGRLTEAPMASNFTARVLQAVDRGTAAEARRRQRRWRLSWLLRWLPRAAVATVVVGAGLVSYHQVLSVRRAKMAESVAVVSNVSSLPGPDVLRDFDAIRALNPTPTADEALLAALK